MTGKIAKNFGLGHGLKQNGRCKIKVPRLFRRGTLKYLTGLWLPGNYQLLAFDYTIYA